MARTDAPTASNPQATAAGRFLDRSYAVAFEGKRSYKLYVPAALDATPRPALPLVIMLHGCTQSPDDFAAGTRMNELAERRGLLVAYPTQPRRANGSLCWNWFRPGDQARGRGEPAIIAGITQEVVAEFGADARRVYVAGLSAGAAMAVVLGRTYPDVYAAVGCHSGLPYAAADDVASAFRVMRHGPTRGSESSDAQLHAPMPTIVFHGEDDATVNPRNGEKVVLDAAATLREPRGTATGVVLDEENRPNGRYRRTVYLDASEKPFAEHWLLHGVSHAWSGGSPDGSHTDPGSIDASAEMIRFFLARERSG